MTVVGKRATGTWKDDPPSKNAGTWTWGRPDATALKRLKNLLGNRPDNR